MFIVMPFVGSPLRLKGSEGEFEAKRILFKTAEKENVVFGLGTVLAAPRGHPAPWLAARGVIAEL